MIQSTIKSVNVNNKHKMKVIREIANATKKSTNAGTEYYHVLHFHYDNNYHY